MSGSLAGRGAVLHGGSRKRPTNVGYEALVEAIRSVSPDDAALPTGRPRKATDDPRLARRRAQYRNAKRRARGLGPEAVPDAPVRYYRPRDRATPYVVAVWLGSHWAPALIDEHGRRIFLGRAA